MYVRRNSIVEYDEIQLQDITSQNERENKERRKFLKKTFFILEQSIEVFIACIVMLTSVIHYSNLHKSRLYDMQDAKNRQACMRV